MSNARKVGFLGKKLGFAWTKMRSTEKAPPTLKQTFRAWAYSKSYFPELGLMYDDIRTTTPELEEALRRLPPHLFDERTFRIDRAIQLSNLKTVLPKDEWMTLEKDTFYLKDILAQVEKEKQEKIEWQRK